MASKLSRMTTDHDEIRRWAEERGGTPAEVARTERNGQTGMIRLDFPGYSGQGSLNPISWEEWFRKFDDSGLALVYQERTAGGQRSNFNKLIGRETAAARAHGENEASRRSLRGRGTRRTASRRRTSARGGSRAGRSASAGRSSRTRPTASRSAAGRRQGRAATATRRKGARRQAPSTIAARLTGRERMPMEEGSRRSGGRGAQRRKSSRGGRTSSRSSTSRKGTRRTPGRTTRRRR